MTAPKTFVFWRRTELSQLSEKPPDSRSIVFVSAVIGRLFGQTQYADVDGTVPLLSLNLAAARTFALALTCIKSRATLRTNVHAHLCNSFPTTTEHKWHQNWIGF